MKKFYLTLTMLSLVTMMSFGQKVAVFCTPVTDPVDATVQKIADSIVAAWPGITVDIIDAATINDLVQADFQAYDAAVLTEWGGSASMGNYGKVGIYTLPTVCLKNYALKKTAPAWHWVTATEWWNQLKTDTVEVDGVTPNPLYADAYVGIVKEPTHPIFGNFFAADQEFTWTTGYAGTAQGYATVDPHIQCVDLKNSAIEAIKNNATMLATNKRAVELDDSPIDGWMWAVEENDSSKRCVTWGVHHLMCADATADFYKLLQNSLAWVLKHEIPNVYVEPHISGIVDQNASDFNLKCIPNPASTQIQINFNLSEFSMVSLNVKDMLGRNIFEQNESMNAGAQKVNVDISDFASGIYIYQITVNGKTQTAKFIAE